VRIINFTVAVVVVEVEVVDVVVVDVVEVVDVEVVDEEVVDVELVVEVVVVGIVLVLVIAVEVLIIVDAFFTAISDVRAVVAVAVLLSDVGVNSTPASTAVVCFGELSLFPLLCSRFNNYFLIGKRIFNFIQ
jgi:hypothetical protein